MVADYVKLIGAQNIHKMKPQEMKFSLIKVNIDKWWGVGEWTMPRCHVEPTISPSFPVPEPTSTRRCAKCWEIYGLGCRGELGIMHREKRRQFTVIHNMCLRYRFSWLCFYSIWHCILVCITVLTHRLRFTYDYLRFSLSVCWEGRSCRCCRLRCRRRMLNVESCRCRSRSDANVNDACLIARA